MLVLEPPPNNRTGVINLNRVYIEDIREVVEQLSSFIMDLQDVNPLSRYHVGNPSVSALTNRCKKVHELYRGILYHLGMEDFLTLDTDLFYLNHAFKSIWDRRLGYFGDLLAQWWCATRALDAGVVAYESGHVSNVDQTSRINLGTFKMAVDDHHVFQRSRSLQYIPRGLKCLAGFFHEHDV